MHFGYYSIKIRTLRASFVVLSLWVLDSRINGYWVLDKLFICIKLLLNTDTRFGSKLLDR